MIPRWIPHALCSKSTGEYHDLIVHRGRRKDGSVKRARSCPTEPVAGYPCVADR